MKKLLAAAAFFFFSLAPLAVPAENGAVDKGSFELGVGNILDIWLFRGDNYESANWIGIGTTPDLTFGYFIANRLMIGTTIGFTTTKYESATESDNTFFIQPVFKYYFPVSEKFLFNLKGFFGWERDKYEGDPDTYARSRFGGGAAGTYLLHRNLGASFGADLIIFPDRKVSGTAVDATSFYVIDLLLGLNVYL